MEIEEGAAACNVHFRSLTTLADCKTGFWTTAQQPRRVLSRPLAEWFPKQHRNCAKKLNRTWSKLPSKPTATKKTKPTTNFLSTLKYRFVVGLIWKLAVIFGMVVILVFFTSALRWSQIYFYSYCSLTAIQQVSDGQVDERYLWGPILKCFHRKLIWWLTFRCPCDETGRQSCHVTHAQSVTGCCHQLRTFLAKDWDNFKMWVRARSSKFIVRWQEHFRMSH